MSAIVPYSHYYNSLVQAELLRRHLYCSISPSSEPQEDPAGGWNRVTGNIIPSTQTSARFFPNRVRVSDLHVTLPVRRLPISSPISGLPVTNILISEDFSRI